MSEYVDIILNASHSAGAPAYYKKRPPSLPPVKSFYCAEPFEAEGFSRSVLAVLVFNGFEQGFEATTDFDLLLAARALATYTDFAADELYTDYFYRQKRGVSRGFAHFVKGTPAAFVFADYIDRDRAVIGSLAVIDEYRGQGLGGRLTAFAASRFQRALLACVPPLAHYYEKYGFSETDELFEYTRL